MFLQCCVDWPWAYSPLLLYQNLLFCVLCFFGFFWHRFGFSLSLSQQRAMTEAQRKPHCQGRWTVLPQTLASPWDSPLWYWDQLRSPVMVLPLCSRERGLPDLNSCRPFNVASAFHSLCSILSCLKSQISQYVSKYCFEKGLMFYSSSTQPALILLMTLCQAWSLRQGSTLEKGLWLMAAPMRCPTLRWGLYMHSLNLVG